MDIKFSFLLKKIFNQIVIIIILHQPEIKRGGKPNKTKQEKNNQHFQYMTCSFWFGWCFFFLYFGCLDMDDMMMMLSSIIIHHFGQQKQQQQQKKNVYPKKIYYQKSEEQPIKDGRQQNKNLANFL